MVNSQFYENVQYVVVKNLNEKQKASGLLSKLGIKTPLSEIPVLGDILF